MFANVLLQILQQGLCYALVAIGVYVSYKILDFPDLTVDSSFPLGGVACIALINSGCHFGIALIFALIVGGAAGCITGFLHVKYKINSLLSGIITMTGLLSVNIAISKGRTLIPYSGEKTLFNNSFISLFGIDIQNQAVAKIIVLVIVVFLFKVLLDLFLNTKMGFMLRAVGDNEQVCISLGCYSGVYKIVGLVIANALVGFAGAVYSQYMNYFDNTSGTGMVVIALASVIIGCALFKNISLCKGTTAAIVGAMVYTAALNVVIAVGVPTVYLKLFMAIAFAVTLVINDFSSKGKER